MPRRKKRLPMRRGHNFEGHVYTRYSDGAYSYRNFDQDTGRLVSTYYYGRTSGMSENDKKRRP